MAIRQWFVAIDDKKDGPFSDERLRELIAGGTVTADTLVWCNGMTNWTRAAEVPGLMAGSPRQASLPPRSGPAQNVRAQNLPAQILATHALRTTVGTWPLFGRGLLVFISQLLVIPIPWVATSFMQWFVEHIELPEGQRVDFAGKPGDIWYVFVLNALCGYVGLISNYVELLVLPLTTLFTLLIARWFCANLIWEGQRDRLEFTGDYWLLLGWTLLFAVSFITIIGWAWVATAWGRWMCKNVTGSSKQLIFTASGWSYLWRSLVFGLTAAFVVPIPWTLCWFVGWVVSQFSLVDAADQSSARLAAA